VELEAFASAFDRFEAAMSGTLEAVAPTSAPLSRDEAWLAAIAKGDRRAFDELYREYGPRIFRFAYRLIHDRAKAEEVTNDVMLEIWKHAGEFERRSSVSTWILGIARYRTLNAVRGKTLHLAPVEEAETVADETTTTAEVALDQAAIGRALRAALDRLSPEHREVIELTFFNDLSYKEIAEIANCPENTVKTRMFHAKKRLEPILATLVAAGALS
jgi:RNA polymerase sigma-70 factor (ECF subfamily)